MTHGLVRRGGEYLILAIALAILLCLAVPAARSRGLPDAHTPFEPRDVETVSGTVARVRLLPQAGGGGRDVTIVLRTDLGDEIPVALAPRRVVKAMGLQLRSGEEVQVAGWRIVRGKPALVAAEISAGGRLFIFRDRYGSPAWHP